MKVCFLISGMARTYLHNLHKYLILLSQTELQFNVYINFASDEDKNYYNNIFNDEIFKQYKFYKKIIFSKNIHNNKSEKENNILNQWYRFFNLFNIIDDEYDIYIRIRPDIQILIDTSNFIKLLNNINIEKLSIPNGFDFYNGINLSNNEEICINDQLAFGNYKIMKLYSEFYSYLIMKTIKIESEKDLLIYLKLKNIQIERIVLPYKIILSECKVISIAGDSGSGKSTLIKKLEDLFLFDNYIVLETDRYHKWERTSTNWNTYTHLNPEANHLEKMSEDVFRLKLGESIFAVDYDHSTGKFTEQKKIESKPFILLCGLHTLFKENLRNISEIKIFVDTQKEIKTQWKIKRDLIERNKPKEEILESIKKRENDYKKFIEPQKFLSDIIIEYINESELELNILINNELNYYTNLFLTQISKLQYKENNFNKYYIDKSKINNTIFTIFISNEEIINKLSEYPFNILQTIIYLCLFKE